MPSQPPANTAAVPVYPVAGSSRKKWGCLFRVSIGLVLLILLPVVAPTPIRSRKKTDATEAMHNARQIGQALLDFEMNHGSFPDADTAETVRWETEGRLMPGGAYSNDFFRQLLAVGSSNSETMFYARVDGVRRPDNNFSRDQGDALEKGECGFTYLLGAKYRDNPKRPVVVTPMIPGTDRFEKFAWFHGKAVILMRDGSVISLPIDKNGHVIIHGKNMMNSDHPIWDGHAPAIAWPHL